MGTDAPSRFYRSRENPHRLPRQCYRGYVTAAFHACLLGRRRAFTDPGTVAVLLGMTVDVMNRGDCAILAYCFMPDHLHLVLRGESEQADIWAAMVAMKRQTGHWLLNNTRARWQKGFYDVKLRTPEAVIGEVEYILLNPVRAKLVADWGEYPFSGRRPADPTPPSTTAV